MSQYSAKNVDKSSVTFLTHSVVSINQ